MKSIIALCLFVGATLAAQTASTPPAGPGSVDSEFAAFQAFANQFTPPGQNLGTRDILIWLEQHMQKLQADGLAFYATHPTDARRWNVVGTIVTLTPHFVKEFPPEVEKMGMRAVIVDEEARRAWQRKAGELYEAFRASSDADASAREEIEWGVLLIQAEPVFAAAKPGADSGVAEIIRRYEAFTSQYEFKPGDIRPKAFCDVLGKADPRVSEPALRRLAGSPNPRASMIAKGWLKIVESKLHPMEMAFTAVDGRKVNLAELRGKVILVDFWATWCGPCKAELPNVIANYKKYHDQGFEVIGIALENAKLSPQDTPEQTAAKLEKAKQVLTDFTAANDMPWPQYFDGKWWKTDISSNFAITAIPAMFLIDQEGKVVSTGVRGEALTREIKRLLKL